MVHDGISQLLDILNMPFCWILVLAVCFRLGVSEKIHIKNVSWTKADNSSLVLSLYKECIVPMLPYDVFDGMVIVGLGAHG